MPVIVYIVLILGCIISAMFAVFSFLTDDGYNSNDAKIGYAVISIIVLCTTFLFTGLMWTDYFDKSQKQLNPAKTQVLLEKSK